MTTNIKYDGLKCDNEVCDYHDKGIKREDFESCIDKPCPKCGENILTFADYMNLLTVEKAVQIYDGDMQKDSAEIKTIKINTHKTITFEDEN